MSENLKRILILLEHLSSAKGEGVHVANLVEDTGLAASTVYRLVHDLEELGYLRKDADRRLLPNFSFEQGLAVSGMDLQFLSEICQSLSGKLAAASEFISLRQQNLFWHISEESALQSIRLRASVGFIRGSYELDCLSRTALSQLQPRDIERAWDVSGFYDVGVSGGKVPWDEAAERIAAVDPDGMQFDLMGNAKGIRRYCVAIKGADGNFAGMLTAAEAATPLRDVDNHVERIREALLSTKDAVENNKNRLTQAVGQFG